MLQTLPRLAPRPHDKRWGAATTKFIPTQIITKSMKYTALNRSRDELTKVGGQIEMSLDVTTERELLKKSSSSSSEFAV